MNDMRPARPKNLATKTVAWPCASGFSIHCRHGLSMHVSLQPFLRTLHPLQLISDRRHQKSADHMKNLAIKKFLSLGGCTVGRERERERKKEGEGEEQRKIRGRRVRERGYIEEAKTEDCRGSMVG